MTASVIATIADTSVRYNRLTISGRDHLNDYSANVTNYAIPIETIRLTEAEPGGVSSLTFSIWDPNVEVILAENDWIEFVDITNSRPRFLGFLASFGVRPEGPHRWVDIECVGIEVLLDWMVVPSLTIPAGTYLHSAIQACVANATGVGWPIRAFARDLFGLPSAFSTQALPVGGTGGTLQTDVVLDGASLRSAIEEVTNASGGGVVVGGGKFNATSSTGQLVTIDFTSGLRVIPTYLSNGIMRTYVPSDYDSLALTNTLAGAMAGETTNIKIEVGSVVRGVYVKGANAAGSGLVSDGSGIVGPTRYINDATSDTGTKRDNIAGAYLYQFSQGVRGSESLTLTAAEVAAGNYRPGATIVYGADAQTYSASTTFVIMDIAKTFSGVTEYWTLSYGSPPRSAIKQMRRLTRAVRS